jgi:TIR domain
MLDRIFINYRREGTADTAGRLYERLAQAFGHKNVFVDFVGVDLNARLNNQVAKCQVFLTVIGPSWLDAKDEAGQHRIHSTDDFVAVEIIAALAHNIPVIPVLVDGTPMPRASDLPHALAPLARRQAVEVRRDHFDQDAEALVERVHEVLDNKASGFARWRARIMAGAAVAALLIFIGTGTYIFAQHILAQAEQWQEKRRAAEAEANREAAEMEKQRLAAEQERQAKAAVEVEANRKAEATEKQRLAAEQERRTRAAAAAEAREAEIQRLAAAQERQAKAADEAEANSKAEEAERQRLAAEQERQAKAAAEAETNRKAEQAEKQPLEEQQQTTAVAEGETKHTSEQSEQQSVAALGTGKGDKQQVIGVAESEAEPKREPS